MTLDLIQKSLTNGCHVVKFWTLLIGSISQTLLAFNSSINFLMYPAVSKDFRSICMDYLSSKFGCIMKLLKQRSTSSSRASDGIEEMNLEPSPVLTHSISPTFRNIKGQDNYDNRAMLLGHISNQEDMEAANGGMEISSKRVSVTHSYLSDLGTPLEFNALLKVSESEASKCNDNVEESTPCLIPERNVITKPSSIAIAHYTVCNDF